MTSDKNIDCVYVFLEAFIPVFVLQSLLSLDESKWPRHFINQFIDFFHFQNNLVFDMFGVQTIKLKDVIDRTISFRL